MAEHWDGDAEGVLMLPSGRWVRGRGLRHGEVDGQFPEFGLYLAGSDPGPMPWPARWLQWPDFWLPTDHPATREALSEAWRRTATERVEIACNGGRGRTGTALACLAILDGIRPDDAMGFVRTRYHARAVEMPWQRRFVRRFTAEAALG